MNDKNLQVLEMLKVLPKIIIKTGSKELILLKYIYQIYSAFDSVFTWNNFSWNTFVFRRIVYQAFLYKILQMIF